MTHNIVAQFSCSLDNNGDLKEYRVVSGSVFNEEYNETLDSATIVLSQVKKEDRLSFIQPFDYVRVFDKASWNSATNKYDFDKLYLVDNFDEKENNIKEHLFGYTINLMSETKILEKIQCPNLTITHDINNGTLAKKTIYEHIKRYMELYVPKIKFCADGKNWSYEPLIKMPPEYDLCHGESSIRHIEGRDFTQQGDEWEYVTFIPWANTETDININEVMESSVAIASVDHQGIPFYNIWVNYNAENNGFNIIATVREAPSGDWDGEISFSFNFFRTNNHLSRRFSVPCADLSFAVPTLRQLLTTLMQQVGCIPIVKNRELSFLDFQKDAVSFGTQNGQNIDYSLENTVNYIRRSLSSDSYVNTLANISEQVLDSENEVVCETLGFRDRSNVILKQKENLKLETSLPIYKVNKCILHAPVLNSGYLGSSYGCFYVDPNQYTGDYDLGILGDPYVWPVIFYKEATFANDVILGKRATIKFRVSRYLAVFDFTINVRKIYFWKRDLNTGRYMIISSQPFANGGVTRLKQTNMSETSTDYIDLSANVNRTFTSYSIEAVFDDVGDDAVGFFFTGEFINNKNGTSKPFTFIKFDSNDPNVFAHDCYGANEPMGGTAASRTWVAQPYIGVDDPEHNPCYLHPKSVFIARYNFGGVCGFQTWDITKLIVENNARNLLDRNFVNMQAEIKANTATIDKLSKYVYGTVGYTIGSREITGFSDVFVSGSQTATGWIQEDYTYIENIVNALSKSGVAPIENAVLSFFEGMGSDFIHKKYGSAENYLATYTSITHNNDVGAYCCIVRSGADPDLSNNNMVDYLCYYYNVIQNSFISNMPTYYTGLLIDLYYQPLNSFNMTYVKSEESIDYFITQYDNNASGLTDFDRLSIHEQEQVDRIGNETLSIQQRTNDFSKIRTFDNGPLYFEDDTNRDNALTDLDKRTKYIIFKRSFSINNNCYNVSYIGSKDAVLKDYFTSIRTKYRAYQYVDYSQSVLRKEKDVVFVRVAFDRYDGDNKIRWGEFSTKEAGYPYEINLIYDVTEPCERIVMFDRNVCYELETDIARISNGVSGYTTVEQTAKNSVSTISTNNSIAFIYEYMDNVGAGPYIESIISDPDLGGIPQTWQIWYQSYNDSHTVKFVSYIGYYSKTADANTTILSAAAHVRDQIEKIERSPIVDSTFPHETVFSIVQNNADDNHSPETNDYSKRLFYKDYSERINHTVQFIYYAPNKDILFSEDFMCGTPLIDRFTKGFTTIVVSDSFTINPEYHSLEANDIILDDISNYTEITVANFGKHWVKIITDEMNGAPILRVFWDTSHYDTHKVIKLCSKHVDNTYADIVVFKRIQEAETGSSYVTYTDYHFTLNDTKSDYVLATNNGVLYRRYKVETYTKSQIIPTTALGYIYSTQESHTYIDLDHYPTADYEFEIMYEDITVSTNQSNSTTAPITNPVFGSLYYSEKGPGVFGVDGAIKIINHNTKTPDNYRQANHTYLIKASYNSELTGKSIIKDLTNGQVFEGTQTGNAEYDSGHKMYVMGVDIFEGHIHAGMKLYYLKIWRNGKLYKDLVPAVNNSTGYNGLYDRCSGDFYEGYLRNRILAGPQKEQKSYPRTVKDIYDEEV